MKKINAALISKAGNWYAEKAIAAVELHARAVLDMQSGLLTASQFAKVFWPTASATEQHLLARAMYNVRKLESFARYWKQSTERKTPFKDARGQRVPAIDYIGQAF